MKKIKELLEKIKNTQDFDKIKFIILYGSVAEGKERTDSDIDICVYYDGKDEEAFNFRFRILSEFDEKYDIKIFQHLPLYVKIEVLKGKVIYCKDKKFLYEIAMQTIREFDEFKHRFYDYIGLETIK